MSQESNQKNQMRRECVICEAEIIVQLLPNRHYTGGHYFGKAELSPGNEPEYWECDNCYNTDESMPQNLT